jgi:hypothetical protein
MQWWQTRLGARANLVARAEHAGDSMPREMIVGIASKDPSALASG